MTRRWIASLFHSQPPSPILSTSATRSHVGRSPLDNLLRLQAYLHLPTHSIRKQAPQLFPQVTAKRCSVRVSPPFLHVPRPDLDSASKRGPVLECGHGRRTRGRTS